ncbi:MAG: hypothetical protein H6746_05165 [Deltaproteobacteria bacterium]|nr:hypothetical protein [Deltaproteobacteria bacterium]
MMRRQRGLLGPLGGPWRWEGILQVINALEGAHPQVARAGPHLEYPWEGLDGRILWPEEHLQIAGKLGQSRQAADVLKFATLVERNFDEIFP